MGRLKKHRLVLQAVSLHFIVRHPLQAKRTDHRRQAVLCRGGAHGSVYGSIYAHASRYKNEKMKFDETIDWSPHQLVFWRS